MLEKLLEAYGSGFNKGIHTMHFNQSIYKQKQNPAFVDNSVVKTTMYVDKDRMECAALISQLPKPETRAQTAVHHAGFVVGYYLPKLSVRYSYSFFPENC